MKLRMVTVRNISNVSNVSLTNVRFQRKCIKLLEIVASNLTDDAFFNN